MLLRLSLNVSDCKVIIKSESLKLKTSTTLRLFCMACSMLSVTCLVSKFLFCIINCSNSSNSDGNSCVTYIFAFAILI